MKKNQEIQPTDIWAKDKTDDLKAFILKQSEEQSKERKLRNDLLSIQYKIEDYIQNDNPSHKLKLHDIVKMYLKTLNITHKRLADLFEMKDSNLHKYLNGQRKLNTSLVLKLSSFSHTNPEYWLRVEVKNEMLEIAKEQQKSQAYQKYDYRNLFATAD